LDSAKQTFENRMIKNIVFDMGQVLTRFDLDSIIRLDNIETGRKLGMDGFCYGGEIPPLCNAMKNAGISVSGNLNE